MTLVNLPYLWAAKGRGGKLYYFYRRGRFRIRIESSDGKRLKPGDDGFCDVYAVIHASFSEQNLQRPKLGTMRHLVEGYRQSADFTTNIRNTTRRLYDIYLNKIVEQHGEGIVATLPREAIYKMRDEFKDTPYAANMLLTMINIIMTFAEDRPMEFHLPRGWRNPARRIKKLKTGKGHRPWEEYEIDLFRQTWEIGTLQRTVFELFLNTGQRGSDVVLMDRRHYHRGVINVVQMKTEKRVWIPVSKDLESALEPWLCSHNYAEFLRTPTGWPLATNYMRRVMRAAIDKADLLEDCTLHGLRYTFATRAIELGLDLRDVESIIGHEATEMMWKYIRQRRQASLTIDTMNRGLANRQLRIDDARN